MATMRSLLLIVIGTFLSSTPTYASSAKTIVILGDSISSGYGLAAEDKWVTLFQHQLNNENLNFAVINESISGEITAGGLARLPKILTRHKPDILVIGLGGNDGLRGLSPKVMKHNLTEMIRLATAQQVRVFLFGMKLPPNYGQAYTKLFEKVYTDVAEEQNIPLLPFFLAGVGGHDELMQQDKIHPNKAAQTLLMQNAWLFLAPFLR